MEIDSSLVMAVFFGVLLLLIILVFGVVIARSLAPKTRSGAPLLASDDGKFEVAGKCISCSHCGGAASHTADRY